MANIRDVASLAGVSIATVSMVLNNKPDISNETREKVLDAVKRLNYQPNIHAKRLFTKKNNIIGVVFVSNVSYTVYSRIFEGINSGAHRLGFDVLSMDEDYFIAQEQDYGFLDNSQVDGLIILGKGFSDRLVQAVQKVKIPVVTCPEKIESFKSVIISPDNFGIARMATEYMIQSGHKKIGFIGSHQKYWFSSQRFQGYLSALYDNGLNIDLNLVVNGFEPLCDGGYKAGQQFLSKIDDMPTALFVVNDFMAMGTIKALKEVGILIPEDISIISCDDLVLSQYFDPPLTTIHISWEKIGDSAAEILVKYITGGEIEQMLYLYPGQLVERNSVKPI